MVDQELAGGIVPDESLVEQPFDCSTISPSVMEGVPRRNQIWVLLEQFVLEPTKGSPASDGPLQPPPRSVVTDPLCEVSHVRVPNPGRERVDRP